MTPPMPPPPNGGFRPPKPQRPKRLRDMPRFLLGLVKGFLTRLFYIFSLVWKAAPALLVAMVVLCLLDGVLPVFGAYISRDLLNEIALLIEQRGAGLITEATFDVMRPLLFLFIMNLIYLFGKKVLSKLGTMTTSIAGELVVNHIKLMIIGKAKEVDLSSYDDPEFYEKLENANREAGNRPIQILSSTFNVISTVISLVGYVIILASALPLAAVAIALAAVPSAIVNFIYRRKSFAYMRFRSIDRRQMNYYSDIMVNKDMVKEIRMFDLGDRFTERFDKVFEGYYDGIRKLIVKENFWQITVTVISSIFNCLFFGMIAYQVFSGRIQIGDYSLYTGALTSIASTVASLISVSASVYEGTLFVDNLISFMKEEKTIAPVLEKPLTVKRGCAHTIEFEHVSFAYPGTERLVLKDINLKFRPGETVVLVGLNGAGKTTFIKLLTRLYDPTEGRILLDGKDLREYDVRELYEMFGIIFQDFGKYAVTVEENISFGDIHRDIDKDDIKRAAEQANATDFISKLPREFDTPMMRFFEPDGIEPSIGQWQKLAIARAFYSTSDILILDEPTASLDPIAEQEIFNQFDMLRKDKTTIFVSHRLSSATIASKIVVLEYGKLIEEGTHKELMEREGRYFELFSTQASRYMGTEE